MNTRSHFALAALVAAAVLALTAPACANRDAWYEATVSGAFMGYAHETVTESVDGLVTTSLTSDLGMRRGEELVSIRGTDEWVESVDGTPVSYSQTRKMAMRTMTMDVTVVRPGRLSIRQSDGREDATFSGAEYEGDLLFPAAIERLHRSKGLKQGSTYRFQTFDGEFAEVANYYVEVGASRDFEIMGETRHLTKLVLTCDLYEGLEFVEWRDANGELWREEVPSVGSVRERTASDVALRERDANDTLAVTTIPSNVSIPRPREIDEALYEVWVEGGDIAASLPEDLRQKIVGTTDRGVLLRVSRVVPKEEEAIKFPVRSTPLKEYLDGNALMQTWYPRILGTAAKTIWDAQQNSWKGGVLLEKWVVEYVTDKGLGTGFASAQEVLESLTGDCTEHAILMATMARSVGIPAKLVAGVVHHEGSFAYHMWVEVWTGGGWYALDPTIGDGSVDATHIKLAESSVRGGRVADLSVDIMKVFSRLGLRVVEYTVDGETVKVSG